MEIAAIRWFINGCSRSIVLLLGVYVSISGASASERSDELSANEIRSLERIVSNAVSRSATHISWNYDEIGEYKAVPFLVKTALGQRDMIIRMRLLGPVAGLLQRQEGMNVLSERSSNEVSVALCEIIAQSNDCLPEMGQIIQFYPDPNVISILIAHIDAAIAVDYNDPLRFGLCTGINGDHAQKLIYALIRTKHDKTYEFILDVLASNGVNPNIDMYEIVDTGKTELLKLINIDKYKSLVNHFRRMKHLRALYMGLKSGVSSVRSESLAEFKREGIDFSFNKDLAIGLQRGKDYEVKELLKGAFINEFPILKPSER